MSSVYRIWAQEFEKESCLDAGDAGEASWLQRSAKRKSLQEGSLDS